MTRIAYLCICSSFSFVALPFVSPLRLREAFVAVHALNAYVSRSFYKCLNPLVLINLFHIQEKSDIKT